MAIPSVSGGRLPSIATLDIVSAALEQVKFALTRFAAMMDVSTAEPKKREPDRRYNYA